MSSQATSRTARTAKGAALAAVVALLLAAQGCGEDEPVAAAEPEAQAAERDGGVVDISGTEPVGEMLAGSVAQLAQCRDWNGASPEERLATLDDVRSQINLEDSGISAPALTDEEAQDLFDDACEPTWAQGFRLYKLYARAAGFITLQREIDE